MTGNGFDLVVPHRGLTARDSVRLAKAAEQAGWTGVWLQEVLGLDALVTLGAIAQETSRVRFGTAIVPITTRSVTLLAMAASTLSQLAPGRFHLGVGVSTPEIVARRHDRPIVEPTVEAAAACELIRQLLDGDTVEHETLPHLENTRIAAPDIPPPVLLAALGLSMTEVAVRHADGLVLNLLTEDEVLQRARSRPAIGFEVQLVIRVAVEPSPGELASLKKELAGYARVPVYRRMLTGLFDLEAINEAPNVAAAAGRVSDDMVEQLAVVGSPDECRGRLQHLRKQGITPLVRPVGDIERCIDGLGRRVGGDQDVSR